MTDSDSPSGALETRSDAGDGGKGIYNLWMRALDLASEEEKDWRKRAQEAVERYRDEKNRRGARFNILYSSVQTQGPALYNSTPRPDVRRRFDDEDPVGRVAAQVFERALSHCIEEYDFDATMECVVNDSLLPGRGVAMVVYDPVVGDQGVDYESVRCEHVQWDDFRRGPGKKWTDVPWVAVRYRITREEAVALNPKEGPTVNLDHVEKGTDKDSEGRDVPDVFKRLTIWKIWDKAQRKVVFLAPSYKDGPFAVEDDPLGLKDFFPFPRPLYDVLDSGSLVPLVPYDMYRDQAEELDRVTRRIVSLVNVLRWRGIRPSQIEEFDRLKDAEDGDLVPSESFSALLMTQGANPESAVWIMPIDKLIVVIRELVVQREAIKQVIFEISGMADIMRGETDPDETLGAQQIKAQWGSLRMQRRQREVQRFARDLIRIKAEIIGEQFSTQTLALTTNIALPTPEQKAQAQIVAQQAQAAQQPVPQEVEQALQLPTWDEVRQIMASDALRSFRVDIETDSTIEADQVRAQQNMAAFVTGLAEFTAAFGPGVQAGLIPKDAAADVLVAFARKFKLGRQAEDALERIGKQARQPQAEQPDPEAMKAQAEIEAKRQEMQLKQAQMQADQQRDAQKLAMEREKMQAEITLEQEKAQQEFALKRAIAEADIQLQREKSAADADLKRQQVETQAEVAREKAQQQPKKEAA